MLRALTRFTIVPRQAHRSNAITQHRPPPLGSSTTAHKPTARANYTSPTNLNPSRAALLAYFRKCPRIGPVTAARLVDSGCRSWAEVVDKNGKAGSGVKLDSWQWLLVREAAVTEHLEEEA